MVPFMWGFIFFAFNFLLWPDFFLGYADGNRAQIKGIIPNGGK